MAGIAGSGSLKSSPDCGQTEKNVSVFLFNSPSICFQIGKQNLKGKSQLWKYVLWDTWWVLPAGENRRGKKQDGHPRGSGEKMPRWGRDVSWGEVSAVLMVWLPSCWHFHRVFCGAERLSSHVVAGCFLLALPMAPQLVINLIYRFRHKAQSLGSCQRWNLTISSVNNKKQPPNALPVSKRVYLHTDMKLSLSVTDTCKMVDHHTPSKKTLATKLAEWESEV